MAANQANFTKLISSQLRTKANDFLNSRKHANNLADILQLFEADGDNFTPLLLTIEVIFTELLKRGDLFEEVVPLQPAAKTPEAQYKKWLRECYEAALKRTLECIKRGRTTSRLQALVTACKLLQAEGRYPLEAVDGYFFPAVRLKNIFTVLLDDEVPMSSPITRFQEFTEYRDMQQYGLKVLPTMAYRKSPTSVYMQNYLELLDKLLASDLTMDGKNKLERGEDEREEIKVLCAAEGRAKFKFHAAACRRHANRCWGFACQWALCSDPKAHRRALLLLVERLMPLLARPQLATDMLTDSLDAGGPISMLALQGVLELVRRHNISYPDIYTRLYALFEPEMFATRYKRRLLHLADIFLSSTHLPEGLVAAFAKRLGRLALLASPEDAVSLLQLITNLLQRHPALKRMICYEDSPAVMSNDPYLMEESCASSSRALGSSLWEVAALRRSLAPAVSAAAGAVLGAVDERAAPPQPSTPSDLVSHTVGSSLWEVAALRRSLAPAVSAAAGAVLGAVDERAAPPQPSTPSDLVSHTVGSSLWEVAALRRSLAPAVSAAAGAVLGAVDERAAPPQPSTPSDLVSHTVGSSLWEVAALRRSLAPAVSAAAGAVLGAVDERAAPPQPSTPSDLVSHTVGSSLWEVAALRRSLAPAVSAAAGAVLGAVDERAAPPQPSTPSDLVSHTVGSSLWEVAALRRSLAPAVSAAAGAVLGAVDERAAPPQPSTPSDLVSHTVGSSLWEVAALRRSLAPAVSAAAGAVLGAVDERAAPPQPSTPSDLVSHTVGSSLWEVAALRRSLAPAVSAAAGAVLGAVDERAAPPQPSTPSDLLLFDQELRRRFKSIEMNFVRPRGASLPPPGERLLHYWDIVA